jgi:hypothetical protein
MPPCLTAAGLAATAAGGRRHMSAGRPCCHREVVHFGNIFEKWSFLTIYWGMWLFLSKFLSLTTGSNETAAALT